MSRRDRRSPLAGSTGVLFVTTHRCLFVPDDDADDLFYVPHAAVRDAEVRTRDSDASDSISLRLVTRDFVEYEFSSRTATNRELRRTAWNSNVQRHFTLRPFERRSEDGGGRTERDRG